MFPSLTASNLVGITFEVEIENGECIEEHTLVGKKTKRLGKYTDSLGTIYNMLEQRIEDAKTTPKNYAQKVIK